MRKQYVILTLLLLVIFIIGIADMVSSLYPGTRMLFITLLAGFGIVVGICKIIDDE